METIKKLLKTKPRYLEGFTSKNDVLKQFEADGYDDINILFAGILLICMMEVHMFFLKKIINCLKYMEDIVLVLG